MYNICILNISIGDRKHSRGNNAFCCLKPMLIGGSYQVRLCNMIIGWWDQFGN